MIRTTLATLKIERGEDILQEGHRVARFLWNELWWCTVGYNRKLQGQREGRIHVWKESDDKTKVGEWIAVRQSLAGKLPPYFSKYSMDKEMRQFWAFRNLSDRCASYTVADFDIAMKSWFSNLKTNSRARPPRPMKKGEVRSIRFQPGRNAKHLGNWRFRLTVLGGHIAKRHAIIELMPRPGVKVSQVRLIQIDPAGHAIVMYKKQVTGLQGPNFAAIDQGIINAACLFFDNGESILYSGKGILTNDQRYAKKIAKCKPRHYPDHNTERPKPSKRQLAYHKKSKNRHRRMVHNITRSIINECVARQVGTIVIGDLRGIRKDKDWGSKNNQWLHRWAFGEFLRQIDYKAEEVSIEVVKISERGTSSACPFCGSVSVTRNPRGLLKCKDCGIVVNSDVAGAANILQKYLPGFSLGVEAILPGLRSPVSTGIPRTTPRISPTFTAKIDLRGLQIEMRRCGAQLQPKSNAMLVGTT